MSFQRMCTRVLWPVVFALTGCGDSGPANHETTTGSEASTTDAPLTLHPEVMTAMDPPPPVTTCAPTSGTAGGTTGDATSTGSGGEDSTTGPGPAPEDCEVLRQDVEDVLQTRCAGCHTGANASKFDYVDDLGLLVSEGKIVMGDPDGSLLWQRVESNSMPQNGPSLTDYEKLELRTWIAECAPPEPPVTCESNPFISTDTMIDRMRLAVLDPTEVPISAQPFIRFFTLTHLYNAGLCDGEIEVYRHALVKLLNSLSNNEQIVELAPPIDPEGTIYRIDLRDYGWESDESGLGDVWDLLVDHDPFAVEYVGDEAEQLKALTGTRVPFQMADWFVTDAARPPLYDRVLYERVFKFTADVAMMTRFDLEAALGISVAADIAAEEVEDLGIVARAGFQTSGVSEQNRVVERHVLPSMGAYWLSYDFKEEAGFGDIFTHPRDFVADGGEIIWNLPNGLQAYLLVDKAGLRLDAADIAIVNNKEDDGAVITNGGSCMGCHYQGMRLASDEVWPYVEQFGDFSDPELQKIASLYAPSTEFAAELDADIERFVDAMMDTQSPLLHDGREAISSVDEAFDDVPLGLRRMAAEFGMDAEAFIYKIGDLPIGLKKISSMPVDRASMRLDFATAVCTFNDGITSACPSP